jgi:hypothetical protein
MPVISHVAWYVSQTRAKVECFSLDSRQLALQISMFPPVANPGLEVRLRRNARLLNLTKTRDKYLACFNSNIPMFCYVVKYL